MPLWPLNAPVKGLAQDQLLQVLSHLSIPCFKDLLPPRLLLLLLSISSSTMLPPSGAWPWWSTPPRPPNHSPLERGEADYFLLAAAAICCLNFNLSVSCMPQSTHSGKDHTPASTTSSLRSSLILFFCKTLLHPAMEKLTSHNFLCCIPEASLTRTSMTPQPYSSPPFLLQSVIDSLKPFSSTSLLNVLGTLSATSGSSCDFVRKNLHLHADRPFFYHLTQGIFKHKCGRANSSTSNLEGGRDGLPRHAHTT